MTDRIDLICAICTDPASDDLRLFYADFTCNHWKGIVFDVRSYYGDDR